MGYSARKAKKRLAFFAFTGIISLGDTPNPAPQMKTKEALANILPWTMPLTVFTIIYLTIPATQIPWVPIWESHQTVAVPLLIGACLLLLAMTVGVPIAAAIQCGRRKTPAGGNLLLATGVLGCLIFAYPSTRMLMNFASWKTATAPTSWEETANLTPAEYAAGKGYLQIIQGETQSPTPEAFQNAITPLLNVERWGFACDDPTLYLINGIKGEPGQTAQNWQYEIPLGNVLNMSEKLLAGAKQDLADGNSAAASEKIRVVLGVGNRVASPRSVIQGLIGMELVKRAVGFLETNRSLLKTEDLEKELCEAEKFQDVMRTAMEQEFNVGQTLAYGVARTDHHLKVGAGISNPQLWETFKKEWVKEADKPQPDWPRFLAGQKMAAWVACAPIQVSLINLTAPAVSPYEDGTKTTARIRALLNPNGA